eukprot:SAG31_NODE_622_length_13493_cov_7.301254_8_plen_221_part_00
MPRAGMPHLYILATNERTYDDTAVGAYQLTEAVVFFVAELTATRRRLGRQLLSRRSAERDVRVGLTISQPHQAVEIDVLVAKVLAGLGRWRRALDLTNGRAAAGPSASGRNLDRRWQRPFAARHHPSTTGVCFPTRPRLLLCGVGPSAVRALCCCCYLSVRSALRPAGGRWSSGKRESCRPCSVTHPAWRRIVRCWPLVAACKLDEESAAVPGGSDSRRT